MGQNLAGAIENALPDASRYIRSIGSSMYIEVVIEGCNYRALVDSGAEVSLIRENLLRNANIKKTNIILVDAQGKVIPSAGEIELLLGIATGKLKHSFIVAAISTDVLLGMDFLTSNKCNIDFRSGSMEIQCHPVPLEYKMRSASKIERDTRNIDSVGFDPLVADPLGSFHVKSTRAPHPTISDFPEKITSCC